MNIYTKQPISIDDQIAKLRSLALIIADEDRRMEGTTQFSKPVKYRTSTRTSTRTSSRLIAYKQSANH